MAYAKARPGKTPMASAGIDSVSHLAGVALQAAGGFESLHAPYKCGAQGVASVVSGETDWVLTPAPATLGLVSAGRLRLLGHSMAPASRPLGAVPASGSTLRGFEFARWIGLIAPKGRSHRSAKRCARPCSKPSCARRSRATAQFQRQTRQNGFGPISSATSNTPHGGSHRGHSTGAGARCASLGAGCAVGLRTTNGLQLSAAAR